MASARISSEMAGLDPKTELAMVGDHRRVLAAETGECNGFLGAVVELEVDKALREHKHITLVKHFGGELVVGIGGDEADVERAFQHRLNLRPPEPWRCRGRRGREFGSRLRASRWRRLRSWRREACRDRRERSLRL
ncbi:hypothetical protein MUK42_22411 [Musa troglodytarum]|uniref:Uncharacterized protein n=1 Tax=Musa troglodytarum TaxID=320322 RepID=A0A9E7GDF7_9LILI|nr:hypothetical protein MUK42_22411 [Musa troglodytarum]